MVQWLYYVSINVIIKVLKLTCDRPDRPDRPAIPFLKLRNFLRYRKKNLLATDPTDLADRPARSVFEIP